MARGRDRNGGRGRGGGRGGPHADEHQGIVIDTLEGDTLHKLLCRQLCNERQELRHATVRIFTNHGVGGGGVPSRIPDELAPPSIGPGGVELVPISPSPLLLDLLREEVEMREFGTIGGVMPESLTKRQEHGDKGVWGTKNRKKKKSGTEEGEEENHNNEKRSHHSQETPQNEGFLTSPSSSASRRRRRLCRRSDCRFHIRRNSQEREEIREARRQHVLLSDAFFKMIPTMDIQNFKYLLREANPPPATYAALRQAAPRRHHGPDIVMGVVAMRQRPSAVGRRGILPSQRSPGAGQPPLSPPQHQRGKGRNLRKERRQKRGGKQPQEGFGREEGGDPNPLFFTQQSIDTLTDYRGGGGHNSSGRNSPAGAVGTPKTGFSASPQNGHGGGRDKNRMGNPSTSLDGTNHNNNNNTRSQGGYQKALREQQIKAMGRGGGKHPPPARSRRGEPNLKEILPHYTFPTTSDTENSTSAVHEMVSVKEEKEEKEQEKSLKTSEEVGKHSVGSRKEEKGKERGAVTEGGVDRNDDERDEEDEEVEEDEEDEEDEEEECGAIIIHMPTNLSVSGGTIPGAVRVDPSTSTSGGGAAEGATTETTTPAATTTEEGVETAENAQFDDSIPEMPEVVDMIAAAEAEEFSGEGGGGGFGETMSAIFRAASVHLNASSDPDRGVSASFNFNASTSFTSIVAASILSSRAISQASRVGGTSPLPNSEKTRGGASEKEASVSTVSHNLPSHAYHLPPSPPPPASLHEALHLPDSNESIDLDSIFEGSLSYASEDIYGTPQEYRERPAFSQRLLIDVGEDEEDFMNGKDFEIIDDGQGVAGGRHVQRPKDRYDFVRSARSHLSASSTAPGGLPRDTPQGGAGGRGGRMNPSYPHPSPQASRQPSAAPVASTPSGRTPSLPRENGKNGRGRREGELTSLSSLTRKAPQERVDPSSMSLFSFKEVSSTEMSEILPLIPSGGGGSREGAAVATAAVAKAPGGAHPDPRTAHRADALPMVQPSAKSSAQIRKDTITAPSMTLPTAPSGNPNMKRTPSQHHQAPPAPPPTPDINKRPNAIHTSAILEGSLSNPPLWDMPLARAPSRPALGAADVTRSTGGAIGKTSNAADHEGKRVSRLLTPPFLLDNGAGSNPVGVPHHFEFPHYKKNSAHNSSSSLGSPSRPHSRKEASQASANGDANHQQHSPVCSTKLPSVVGVSA